MTLLAALGEGGMATVYLASLGLGASARLVAVKLLRPGLPDHDYRTRFLDEAKLVLRLHRRTSSRSARPASSSSSSSSS
ncbi:hypothetical protein [Nannocystis pusilla]|uniref:hypothetical protein n=1 Tax=Nannocystis pusilla TaxID=889268 RepID=UPI003B7DBDC4